MKTRKNKFIRVILTVIFSAIMITSCATEQQSESAENEKKVVEKKTGWNDREVAKYAAYVNSLMKADGYTGFWWDCNDLIDRFALCELTDLQTKNFSLYQSRKVDTKNIFL